MNHVAVAHDEDLRLVRRQLLAVLLMQLVFAATLKEREIWKGVYSEVITKAMIMYNQNVLGQKSKAKKLDPSKIGVEIPFPSESEWLHFEKVWLPLWLAGKITDELALSKLPGTDAKAELDRQHAEEETEVKTLKEENEQLKVEKEEAEITEEIGQIGTEEVIT